MVGTQIGNYRIEEKLGEGGMGVVYRAVDINLDRVVAVKALNTVLRGNLELEQRFRAEAKAQAALNHTNLTTLYTLLIEDGRPWMVMEYVEGENLAQMIQRRGVIPSEEAIPLFRQALLGIGYAHRMGIVHRDIKPSNIMVNRQGIVKVMDFGIAKVLGGHGLTRTGTQMGTAFYMSPEQVLNRGVDIRSDIYSLGVTLYEILTANVPFGGDSDFQIMNDHVNTPPPLLTKFYPYVPAGVQNAVLKAIEKKPDARFQTVEEFGAALEHPNDFGVVPGIAPAPTVVAPQAIPDRRATVVETAPRQTGPGVPVAPVPVTASVAPVPAPNPTSAPVSTPTPAPQPVLAAQPAPSPHAEKVAPKPSFGIPQKVLMGGGIAAVVLVAAVISWYSLKPQPKPQSLPPVAEVVPPAPAQVPDGALIPIIDQSANGPSQAKQQPSGSPNQSTQTPSGKTPPPQNQSSQATPPPPVQTPPAQPQPVQPARVQSPVAQKPPVQPPAIQPPAGQTPPAAGVVIPAGTIITVRMISTIDSSVNTPGQRFEASVDLPVLAFGKVVIPRGTPARVLLDNVAQAGRFQGRSAAVLELVNLTLGGFSRPVRSLLFEQQGLSRGIFGRGKAAAAGVVVPAETRISFTLRAPIKVLR